MDETITETRPVRRTRRARLGRLAALAAVTAATFGGTVAGGASPASAALCTHDVDGNWRNLDGNGTIASMFITANCDANDTRHVEYYARPCPNQPAGQTCLWGAGNAWYAYGGFFGNFPTPYPGLTVVLYAVPQPNGSLRVEELPCDASQCYPQNGGVEYLVRG